MSIDVLKRKIKGIKWNPSVKLLNFDANGLIAIDKRAGILAHPNTHKDILRSVVQSEYCMDEEMYICKAENEDGGRQRVWLLNRLDSATSGVLLLAICPEVANSVKSEFQNHQVIKSYRAVVFGKYQSKTPVTIWSDKITTSKERGQLRSRVDEYNGLATETKVELVKHLKGFGTPLSVLEMTPVTGRTHQLRVHAAKHGFPIVGDSTYGDFSLNQMTKWFPGFEDRLYLHAHRISLVYTLSGGKPFKFTTESKLSKPPQM